MRNNLSICIVGKDNSEFLQECIESCLKLSPAITYVDTGSSDDSLRIAKQNGVSVLECKGKMAEIEEFSKRCSNSEWILFIKPCEKPVFESDSNLEKVLIGSSQKGYTLFVRSAIDKDDLIDFQWMTISDQYKHVGNFLYVSKGEIRLVRHQYGGQLLKLMMDPSNKNLFSINTHFLEPLKIHRCNKIEREKENSPETIKNLQLKYLKGEVPFDPEERDGLKEFADDFFSFAILTKEDFDRYCQGLSMGFGGERMYLHMLHYIGEAGKYEKARDFIELWQDKWGFFDTPEPYRVAGIIYAHLFDLKKAEACFDKFVELASGDRIGDGLSLLSRICLLQGKKHKAISLLERAQKAGCYNEFDCFVLRTIKNKPYKTPRLSVCIIAKNETKTIRKTLESISHIADEVIVVDTGSTDNTKDIVNEFKAKIIDRQWDDDFSKVRNVAIGAATGDYILFMDADEYIDIRNRIKLGVAKQILPAKQDVAFRIRIEPESKYAEDEDELTIGLKLPDIKQPEYPIRLFPACQNIRFEGRAFETVDKAVNDLGLKIEKNELFKMIHSESDRKVRDKRKESAVRSAVDFISDPHAALKGALYFLRLGELDTALKWLEKADVINPRLLEKIIELYASAGLIDRLTRLIDKSLKNFPNAVELALAKAEIYFARGEFKNACNILEHSMGALNESMERENRAKAAYLYGMSLLETEEAARSIEYLIVARDENPLSTRYKIGSIYALAKFGEWESAIGAVSDILEEENLEYNRIIDDFADIGIILSKLSRHFIEKNKMEEASFCQRIFKDIVQNKLSKEQDVEKMAKHLATLKEFKEENCHA